MSQSAIFDYKIFTVPSINGNELSLASLHVSVWTKAQRDLSKIHV